MNRRLLAVLVLLIAPLLAVSALAPAHAQSPRSAHNAQSALTVNVKGTFSSSAGGLTGPGTLTGTFTLHRVAQRSHHLYALGTLSATLKDAQGVTKSVSRTVSLLVSGVNQSAGSTSDAMSQAGSCNILTLNIGAIHLNLLGLVVDLSPINLNITGQTGSGNLLGNLLCGVAGLLDNLNLSNLTQQLLTDVVMLLNQAITRL